MIKTDVTLYVSKDFKTILTRGNKYEDYVLEIMNLSSNVFPNSYKKIEPQSNGEPDFEDLSNGDAFDAKLVVDEGQCRALCGNNDFPTFFQDISSQNNDIYDSIVAGDNKEISLVNILEKQLNKDSTQDKNIVFFFTFPIGAGFATSIASALVQNYLTFLFSKIQHLANGRRIIGICPTFDGYYEIREMGCDYSEFVEYHNLDKYFKWYITGHNNQ